MFKRISTGIFIRGWSRLICFAMILAGFTGCFPAQKNLKWKAVNQPAYSGTAFYKQAAAYNWRQRDSLAIDWILAGKVPSFIMRFEKVKVEFHDSSSGQTIYASYFVSPDYLAVGNNEDWARVPITPMAAQRIADTLNCFLPTRKMVDDIYRQARVKLAPVPMYAFRDSTPTMWQHHLIIEGQRRGRKGLIAGIKKDVVISQKLLEEGRANRVAIYGWHQPDGKPIQPLYTGHVNWYVDYSHGIRLVSQTIYVNNKPMHYTEVLKHHLYRRLICDEEICGFFRY